MPFPLVYRIEEVLAIWRRASAPMLWVGAAESFVKKWLSQGAYTLAQRQSVWRDLRYVEIAEAGHMLHHDQPEAVARVVETFLLEK